MESHWTNLGASNLESKSFGISSPQSNTRNRNSLDLDHLNHTLKFPKAFMRNKVIVFHLYLYGHTHRSYNSDILPWKFLRHTLGHTPLDEIPAPLFLHQTLSLTNLLSLIVRGVMDPRKAGRQGVGRI